MRNVLLFEIKLKELKLTNKNQNNMKNFCKKHSITENQFLGKEEISGSLYLSSLTSIPEGFNQTVGGDLYLSSLTSIPEGFNPTVGGDLYLKNSTKRIRAEVKPISINKNFFWKKNNKTYAKIDGIFCEIINEKETVINVDLYKVYNAKKINRDEFFVIINKGSYYSHGSDIKKAFEDLKFKIISEKLKKEPINKETMIDIKYYRIITGACEMGCQDWIKQNNIIEKEISAQELYRLLEKTNAYGFEKFKQLVTF